MLWCEENIDFWLNTAQEFILENRKRGFFELSVRLTCIWFGNLLNLCDFSMRKIDNFICIFQEFFFMCYDEIEIIFFIVFDKTL